MSKIKQVFTVYYDVNKGNYLSVPKIVFNSGDRNTCIINIFIMNGYNSVDITGYKARAFYIPLGGSREQSNDDTNEVTVNGDKVRIELPTSRLIYKENIAQISIFNDEEKKILPPLKYYVRETAEGEYVGTSNNKDLLQQLDGKIDGLTKRVDNLEENGGNGGSGSNSDCNILYVELGENDKEPNPQVGQLIISSRKVGN